MEISYVMSLAVPGICVLCAIVGYCIKNFKCLSSMSNDAIPTILVVLGIICSIAITHEFTFEAVLAGAVSGVLSTGLHQLIKNTIKKINKLGGEE